MDTLQSQHSDTRLPEPRARHSFTKQPLTWELMHRRLCHVSDGKLEEMCRKETLLDLPKRHNKNKRQQQGN